MIFPDLHTERFLMEDIWRAVLPPHTLWNVIEGPSWLSPTLRLHGISSSVSGSNMEAQSSSATVKSHWGHLSCSNELPRLLSADIRSSPPAFLHHPFFCIFFQLPLTRVFSCLSSTFMSAVHFFPLMLPVFVAYCFNVTGWILMGKGQEKSEQKGCFQQCWYLIIIFQGL